MSQPLRFNGANIERLLKVQFWGWCKEKEKRLVCLILTVLCRIQKVRQVEPGCAERSELLCHCMTDFMAHSTVSWSPLWVQYINRKKGMKFQTNVIRYCFTCSAPYTLPHVNNVNCNLELFFLAKDVQGFSPAQKAQFCIRLLISLDLFLFSVHLNMPISV